MPSSEFIDVGLKIKCEKCGYESENSIGVHSSGNVGSLTFCGKPPWYQTKDTPGCGAEIRIKGSWEYKIDEIVFGTKH